MARSTPDIPNASMADIAFLLLTFFLMTTTVPNDKGLLLFLPPPPEAVKEENVEIPEKNLFKIQINSFDNLLVENEIWNRSDRELTDKIKEFILNYGQNPQSSDNPEKAIVSFKTDRGTTHKKFIQILDAAEAAYNEIYAENAGIPVDKWREVSSEPNASPENRQLYDRGRKLKPDGKPEIPKNLSIAEPTKVGG
ncbi:MAG: biopolymer transporter ExbD [Cyclobacteriaceae bacterium]|nr:biopolymer transporter ExbD [Cyclobacteriaceae bacterium]